MQVTLLVSILLITLIYLHVKASHLIFQRDIRIAKVLSIIVLVLSAFSDDILQSLRGSGDGGFIFLYVNAIWVLLLIAYWKLFSGCYNYALFKRKESKDSALREKVRDILLEVSDKKQLTPEWKNFLKVNSDDPLIEEIRDRCKNMRSNDIINAEQIFTKDDFEILKNFAEQLAN